MSGAMSPTLPLVAASFCLLFVGMYSMKGTIYTKTGKEPTFLGANLFYGSPAKIAEKYKVNMFPHPWLGSIIRPLCLLWNIAGMVFILRKYIRGQQPPLRPCCFRYWAVAFGLSIVWAIVMDREMLVTTTIVLAMTLSCYGLTLKEACDCDMHERQRGAAQKTFVHIVIEGIALMTTWTFMAFAMTFSMAISYKGELDSESAQSSGFLTMEECTSVGLILDLVAFVVWWILDIAYWGRKTDCIKSVYWISCIAMFSVGLHNHNAEGASLNNVIAYFSSLLSAAAYVTRRKAKTFFLGEYNVPPQKNHVH